MKAIMIIGLVAILAGCAGHERREERREDRREDRRSEVQQLHQTAQAPSLFVQTSQG